MHCPYHALNLSKAFPTFRFGEIEFEFEILRSYACVGLFWFAINRTAQIYSVLSAQACARWWKTQYNCHPAVPSVRAMSAVRKCVSTRGNATVPVLSTSRICLLAGLKRKFRRARSAALKVRIYALFPCVYFTLLSFYFIWFICITLLCYLFYFILLRFIAFYFIPFYFIINLFHFIQFILFYFFLFYCFLFYLLFYFVIFCLC